MDHLSVLNKIALPANKASLLNALIEKSFGIEISMLGHFHT